MTAVYVAFDKDVVAIIALKEVSLVRPEAEMVVSYLLSTGYKVWMITGDNEGSAKAVGEKLGITNIASNCYPDDKKALVERLQGKQMTDLTADLNSQVHLTVDSHGDE
jgi:P-type E1-E2 ATPase